MVPISTYYKKCKTTIGGVKKFYLFPFVKYKRSQIITKGMELITFPSTGITEFDVIGSYSQNSEFEGGDLFFNQSCNFNLSEVYNVLDVQNLLVANYGIIFLTNNNEYLIAGTRNGLTGTTNNTSGTEKAEFNGFTVDFTGKEETPLLLIKNLDDVGFWINENGLNYILNFGLNE
jgi:hypothetical protein